MADTTVIAITGIVVSGLLGPAAAALWARRQAKAERSASRADADLAELRELFAECLQLMRDTFGRLAELSTKLNGGFLDPVDEQTVDKSVLEKYLAARKKLVEVQEQLKVMLQERPRLILFLGRDHPVTAAFDSNTDAIKQATEVCADVVQGKIQRSDAITAFDAAFDLFKATMDEFIDTCSPIATRRVD